MLRLILTLGLFGGLVVASAATADDNPAKKGDAPPADKKGPPAMDGTKLFKQIDADGDGKISKDEFKDFLNLVAGDQVKGRERLINLLFRQLDTNRDGYLSPEEFKAAVARFRDRLEKLPKQ
jgi:hypothetical protein